MPISGMLSAPVDEVLHWKVVQAVSLWLRGLQVGLCILKGFPGSVFDVMMFTGWIKSLNLYAACGPFCTQD